MRIAWLGPEPSLGGGVTYAATQILLGLTRQGAEVDAFVAPVLAPYGEHFEGRPGLRIFEEQVRWEWERWYSREPVLATVTSLVARGQAQKRLVADLKQRHRDKPYDVIYQFSQFEVPWLRGDTSAMPPVVIHPEVHAAGELRWHRRERRLALRCSGRWRAEATTIVLAARTLAQRRYAGRVAAVIAPSRVFAEHMRKDYAIPRDRMFVVPNPIDVDRYRPTEDAARRDGLIELLFVSRMSVRKGVEMIVALSHRLARQDRRFHLRLVGTGDFFSDYRPLLDELNTDVATYVGQCAPKDLVGLYRTSDIVVQPSHYEPFALSVGEALASGTPVVVSDEVGAGESLPEECCRTFHAGNLDAFEAQIRAMSAALEQPGRRPAMRAAARREAENRFAPDVVSDALLDVFAIVAGAAAQ